MNIDDNKTVTYKTRKEDKRQKRRLGFWKRNKQNVCTFSYLNIELDSVTTSLMLQLASTDKIRLDM